ncbi:MAG: GNAT family N-acetyltransferase [Bacteroidetes bacterium]|nr:GNAT family N-acetyltransferase [Fibrella sp.]
MESSQPDSAVLIRPAERRDGDAVYAFLCELEHQLLDPTAFKTVFQRNLTAEGIYYLVAELDNQLVGFVSCHIQYLLHHVGRIGEIQELFVVASHRNQRVGRQLINALDALARQHGLTNLEVTTNRTRADTHRFYERLGFVPTHYKFVKHYP